ncbi:hypothetical protein LTR09_000234 [Extremus antarcticus]|uniref:RING-type domain-containing protein n=1 Tax=Extremus antarcticus TaxID=702011 RepID=A0AAJ0GJ96_9PEZI|nr:hypothetical protein LTR09_000234 [Extremus antarcticus]
MRKKPAKWQRPTYFFVEECFRDQSGTLIDLRLRKVPYHHNPSEEHEFGSYYIHGNTLRFNQPTLNRPSLAQNLGTKLFVGDDEFEATLEPDGDKVRTAIHRGQCPARCSQGFLNDQDEVDPLLETPRFRLPDHQPLCPVCVGHHLSNEYQLLRFVRFTQGVQTQRFANFYHHFNARVTQLGYPRYAWYSQNFGALFSDSRQGHAGLWWPAVEVEEEREEPEEEEPEFQPATEAAIAALPHTTFGEVKQPGEEERKCGICREEFGDDHVVAQLPCGHIYCPVCIVEWLRTSNACPECRAAV